MKEKSFQIATALAVLVALFGFSMVVTADDADAASDLSGQYGSPSVIEIAPGFQWSYTPSFPSDLTDYITVSLQVNDSNIGNVQDMTVTVTIPRLASPGTVYNVVIKAAMSEPVSQTAYQYVQFKVIEGLSVSGTINDIVKGSNIDFTPTGTSGMGDVEWKVKDTTQLPDGLSLHNGKVTGEPTEIGAQTVSLTATAHGQSKDLVISFTVYSKINATAPETIRSYNTHVSSATMENAPDIGVTWALKNGTIPSGFELDTSTGVISGQSSAVKSTQVTIEGTTAHGPTQKVTKVITIQSEPELVLSGGNAILTYKNNASAVTSTVSANSVSAITWTENSDMASIAGGVVTVQNPSTAGMSQTIKVTATTLYGQEKTKEIALKVEDTLSISGDEALKTIVREAKSTGVFSIAGGSGNELSVEKDEVGLTAEIVGGALQVSSASPLKAQTVKVIVTSDAGQTASMNVTVDIFNKLTFSSAPSGGTIIYAV